MTTQTLELQAVTDEELQAAAGGFAWGLLAKGAKELGKAGIKGAALGAGFEGGKELVKLGTGEA